MSYRSPRSVSLFVSLVDRETADAIRVSSERTEEEEHHDGCRGCSGRGTICCGRVGWRVKGAQSWERAPIMDFRRASAVEVWAGRLVPSRHNTSAPDTVFRDFKGR